MTRQKERITDTNRRRRRTRCDKGTRLLTERDLVTLRWIADQQAVTMDHIRLLLSRTPGPNAVDDAGIGEGAARMVVARWLDAGWVEKERTLVKGQTWVWLTAKGLGQLHLPFFAHRPAESTRKHLDAVNTIRLDTEEGFADVTWLSERHLRAGIVRQKSQRLTHMPDAILQFPDDGKIAIEVELTMKRLDEFRTILMEFSSQLVPEEEEEDSSPVDVQKQIYEEVWYYAPPSLAQHLATIRDRLVDQGDLTEEEAEAFSIFSYPPVEDEEPL